MNKSYNLQLTEEEIKAIQDYTGYIHTQINALASLDYKKVNELNKTGWNMDVQTEELESLIMKFVNIYSAIYKSRDKEGRSRLYRGTNKQEISEIQRNKSISSIISTSLEEEMTKNFTPYGPDACILRIRLEKDLPYLYIEPNREEDRKNEEEVLILPFTKVKKLENTSNWNGYLYYDMDLEKEELEEVPKQELEALKAQLMEGYDYYKEQSAQCIELEDSIEYIYEILRKNNLSKEDRRELGEQLSKKSKEYGSIIQSVKEYQKQFARMLKGMCKEKELEIDKQQETEKAREETQKKQKKEERKKQLELETKKLRTEIQKESTDIVEDLEEYIEKIEANVDRYQNIAVDLKVNYSMRLHFRSLEEIETIKKKLQNKTTVNKTNGEASIEELEQEYERLLIQKQQLSGIKQIMIRLPKYIEKHNEESFQEIKTNLNLKVQGIITKIKVKQLKEQKQQISKERDSKLQKWLYGTTLKEQRLENIDAKIEYEKIQESMRNPENSVKIMMSNLYDCSAQNLNGQFSQEMLDIIYAIRRNFNKLPDEQKLAQQSYQDANSNYLAIQGKNKRSKRRQIEYYRQDTQNTKMEIYNKRNNPKAIHNEVKIKSINRFEEAITSIKSMLENGNGQEHQTYRDSLQTDYVV